MDLIAIIIGIVALGLGVGVGKFLFTKDTKKQITDAENQAQIILKEAQIKADTLKKEKELEVKEKFVQLKSEYEKLNLWDQRESSTNRLESL